MDPYTFKTTGPTSLLTVARQKVSVTKRGVLTLKLTCAGLSVPGRNPAYGAREEAWQEEEPRDDRCDVLHKAKDRLRSCLAQAQSLRFRPSQAARLQADHHGNGQVQVESEDQTVRGEVYWGHADQDQSMTPESIATLDQAMDDAGVHHTTELYEGAQHGYTMSDMGAYNEAAAERHFTALFALLQRVIPR
jgi:Dienelactone hydrolase family